MTSAFPGNLCVAHAVALNRLRARRADDAASAQQMTVSTGFADTVPLWFRSEAFAEDVVDPARAPAGAEIRFGAQGLQGVDLQVLAAGAAVLRLSLQALKLQRRR